MPVHRTAVAMGAGLALVIGLTGCSSPAEPGGAPQGGGTPVSSPAEVNPGGDIPDTQAFIPVKAPSGSFEVQVPEGWAGARSGSSLRFTDKFNSVAVDERTGTPALTVQSVKDSEVPRLQRSVPHFVLKDVTPFTRGGGKGVLIRYAADSSPDPVTHKTVRQALERYLFWNKGTLAALTLSGPDGADNADPWAKVSGSFRWLR